MFRVLQHAFRKDMFAIALGIARQLDILVMNLCGVASNSDAGSIGIEILPSRITTTATTTASTAVVVAMPTALATLIVHAEPLLLVSSNYRESPPGFLIPMPTIPFMKASHIRNGSYSFSSHCFRPFGHGDTRPQEPPCLLYG